MHKFYTDKLMRFIRHIKNLVSISLLFFFYANNCFAITSMIQNNYNFGTFTQTNKQASFVLSYDGTVSLISNLSRAGNPVVGTITYSTEQNGDNITFNNGSSVVELDGCTLTFSNITPSVNDIVLNPGQGKTRNVSFGVTVNIDGFCAEGTYNTSGIQIDATASKTTPNTTLITFTIVFNEHIEVIETKVMNFGKFFARPINGNVVISPSGQYQASGVDMVDVSEISPGNFTIGGLINREVQLTFSDAILSNGTSSMSVTNINADTGNNFTVTSDKMAISVGGTLNVNANQPYGVYTGSYTLTITY